MSYQTKFQALTRTSPMANPIAQESLYCLEKIRQWTKIAGISTAVIATVLVLDVISRVYLILTNTH